MVKKYLHLLIVGMYQCYIFHFLISQKKNSWSYEMSYFERLSFLDYYQNRSKLKGLKHDFIEPLIII